MLYKTIKVPDHVATGAYWRAVRVKHGMSLRALARTIGYSAPYLSDIELGRRSWTTAAEGKYMKHFNQGAASCK